MESNSHRALKKNIYRLRFLKSDHEDHETILKEAKLLFFEEFSRLHKNIKSQILRKQLEGFRGHPEDFVGEGHFQDPIEPKKDDHPQWAKKLYKKVARQTHPDKLLNLGLEENQKNARKELFRKCSDSFSTGEYGELLDAAIYLDIEIDGWDDEYVSHIKALADKINENINSIKNSIEVVWFSAPEENRKDIMQHYFNSQGLPDPYDKDNWKKPTRRTGEKPKREKRK